MNISVSGCLVYSYASGFGHICLSAPLFSSYLCSSILTETHSYVTSKDGMKLDGLKKKYILYKETRRDGIQWAVRRRRIRRIRWTDGAPSVREDAIHCAFLRRWCAKQHQSTNLGPSSLIMIIIKKNAERSLHFPLASHPQRVLQQSSVRERRGSTFRTNPRSWSFCGSPHTAHVLWDHVAALGALERLRKFWEILEGAEDPVTQRRRTSTAQQGTKHGATAAGFKNNRYEFIPIVFKSQSHCKEAHLNFPGLCTFTLIELTACSGRTFPHHIWNDTPVKTHRRRS